MLPDCQWESLNSSIIIINMSKVIKYDVITINDERNIVSFLLNLTTPIMTMHTSQRNKGMNGTINSPVFSQDTPSELTE